MISSKERDGSQPNKLGPTDQFKSNPGKVSHIYWYNRHENCLKRTCPITTVKRFIMTPTPEQIEFLRNFCGQYNAPPTKFAYRPGTSTKLQEFCIAVQCLLSACGDQRNLEVRIRDCQSKWLALEETDFKKNKHLERAGDLLTELSASHISSTTWHP
jgi:hypothetical protein